MKIILFFTQTIETNSFFFKFSQKFFSKVDFGHLFLSIFQNPKKVLEKEKKNYGQKGTFNKKKETFIKLN